MTETALGLVKTGSFQVPALIADIGPEATKRYFEFFTVPIRNKNTRIAYYHAIRQFLAWCQRAGFRDLEDIEPITVAAYVEQHSVSPATIKQHMSAIRTTRPNTSSSEHEARSTQPPEINTERRKTPSLEADIGNLSFIPPKIMSQFVKVRNLNLAEKYFPPMSRCLSIQPGFASPRDSSSD